MKIIISNGGKEFNGVIKEKESRNIYNLQLFMDRVYDHANRYSMVIKGYKRYQERLFKILIDASNKTTDHDDWNKIFSVEIYSEVFSLIASCKKYTECVNGELKKIANEDLAKQIKLKMSHFYDDESDSSYFVCEKLRNILVHSSLPIKVGYFRSSSTPGLNALQVLLNVKQIKETQSKFLNQNDMIRLEKLNDFIDLNQTIRLYITKLSEVEKCIRSMIGDFFEPYLKFLEKHTPKGFRWQESIIKDTNGSYLASGPFLGRFIALSAEYNIGLYFFDTATLEISTIKKELSINVID